MPQNDWVDIPDVAKKLQRRAESILKDWFPNGKTKGNEFLVGSLNGEAGQSLRINMETGRWIDFASQSDKGGDLVSLYASMKKITNGVAAKILANDFDIEIKTERKLEKSNVVGIFDPFHDPRYGTPVGKWLYYKDEKPYFYVCRYETIENDKPKKTFQQFVQREDGVWILGLRAAGINPQYPLFKDKLETDTILIVEGEKTCIAARKVSPHDVVTWFGGVSNIKNADWSPLYGKKIIVWPDNDQPGWNAAKEIRSILKEHCPSIRFIETSKFPKKYDAYDFVNDKKNWNDIGFQAFVDLELELNNRGEPYVNESNMEIILTDKYPNRIWYDEFRCKKMLDDKPLTDDDYSAILVDFQRNFKMHGITQNIIYGGIRFHCTHNRRNPVREYYENLDLKWDGVSRIKYFMNDVYGSPKTQYTMEVSRNFFLALVARVLSPGCKLDHVFILEGMQGLKKSMSLSEIVGQEFYWDCSESMDSKDFIRGLKGKMIVELSEMASIIKSDVEMAKKVLSCYVDEYVEKYQTESIVVPRTCVFVGTTNETEYLKDVTGNRRFWPIEVKKEADIDYIKQNREQLFAEAAYRHKQGENYWEFKEEESKKEAVEKQESRLIADEWLDPIGDILSFSTEVTLTYVLEKLGIPKERITHRESLRAARCLKMLGFNKVVKRYGDKVKRVWVKE